MEIPIKENEDGKKRGGRERSYRRKQRKNREKNRDQEATFVEIREETESETGEGQKAGKRLLPLPPLSLSSLFPFHLLPLSSGTCTNKVQEARLLESVRTEKNVVEVGNRNKHDQKKLYQKNIN